MYAFLVDSLGKCRRLKYICCLHEQAAGIAAEAYSEYSNNLGVVLVTTGPGGTNAITAVAGAWIDSIPLLIISGQVKRSDTILDPLDIKYHLEKAIYFAKTGRPGPVWLDIPLDVQGAIIDKDKLKGFTPPTEPENRSLASLVDKSIAFLNQSERPVILAGNGIRLVRRLKGFYQLYKNT